MNLQLKRLVGSNVRFLLSNCANNSEVASSVLEMAVLLNVLMECNENTLLVSLCSLSRYKNNSFLIDVSACLHSTYLVSLPLQVLCKIFQFKKMRFCFVRSRPIRFSHVSWLSDTAERLLMCISSYNFCRINSLKPSSWSKKVSPSITCSWWCLLTLQIFNEALKELSLAGRREPSRCRKAPLAQSKTSKFI